MKILDTVVLIASLDPMHPLFNKAVQHLYSVRTANDIFVLCLTLHECNLVLRKRKFPPSQRERIFRNIALIIPKQKLIPTEASIIAEAEHMAANRRAHGGLFDVLIAAAAKMYNADVISTDSAFDKMGVKRIW
ncbi:MAG: PIN domain-containing protein [Candidatus Bathyarchaeia archaeon]